MRKRALWLALMACVALLMAAAFTVAAPAKAYATGVNYIQRTWDDTNKRVVETKQTVECIEFRDVPEDDYEIGNGNWYIARNFSDKDRPKVVGTANLILENGIDMHLKDGIRVPAGSTLNIYTHVYDDGTKDAGKLRVNRAKADAAAIGGNSGENGGNITIYGGTVDAKGDWGAGIGGGQYGGRGGSITIESGQVTATGARRAAGIGSGRWSHLHGNAYYSSPVSVTIKGGTINAQGGESAAGIGGGYIGASGAINISGGNIYTKGGKNGGAGIGSGCACFHDEITTTSITITGGTVKAIAGDIDVTSNNIKADPGAAIGAGGTAQEASIGNASFASYFIGDIWFTGGTIEAYAADITKSSGTSADTLTVIGTTDKDNRDWYSKGFVHFNGATVDMYPGAGSPNGVIKQMVRASETTSGGIQFSDSEGKYQRVTYATQNGSVNKMKEALETSRYLVLTGGEGVEDFEGVKEQVNHYQRVRVESVHLHDFTYTVNAAGDTITATCANSSNNCPLKDAKAELTIAAPTLKTYRQTGNGISAEAVVIDKDHIRDGAKVQYYKANDQGTAKLDDYPLEQAPSVPGKYWAEITIGTEATDTAPANQATAHVFYEIAKIQATAQATVEARQTINLAETVNSILTIETGDTVSYAFNGNATTDEATGCYLSENNLTAGDQAGEVPVNVSVTDAEGNETMRAVITVSVIKKKPQVIEADDVVVVLGETGKSINASVTVGNTSGSLTYEVKADPWGEATSSPISVDPGTGELHILSVGTAYVTVTAPGNDVYAETKKDVKVTVTKKPINLGVSIENWAYGVAAKTPHITYASGVTIAPSDVTYEYKAASDSDLFYDYAVPTQAGNYVVRATVDETESYEGGTATAEFTIAKRDVNVQLYATDKYYDGTTDAYVVAYADETTTGSGLVAGDSITIWDLSDTFDNEKVGVNKTVTVNTADISGATITGENEENYNVIFSSITTTASIEKAWLIVVADDAKKGYGERDPEFTANVYTAEEALIYWASVDDESEWSEDDIAALDTMLADDTTERIKSEVAYEVYRDPGEAAGTYNINVAIDSEDNPNIGVVSYGATFTIVPLECTLAFNLDGGTLDGKTGSFTIKANYGDTVYLPGIPTKSGCTFKNWGSDEYAANAKYTVEGDHSFTAVWEGQPDSEASGKVSMYRLYNPNSGEHFYTASMDELHSVCAAGWNWEGIGWTAPKTSNTPVYRLYNSYGGEHHYTMSIAERNYLVAVGWTDEGIGWYSDDAKAVPIYREYNPNAYSCNHNYTRSYSEHSWLVRIGWRDEGVAWYGVTANYGMDLAAGTVSW